MPHARDCLPRGAGPILFLSLAGFEFAVIWATNIYLWVVGASGSIVGFTTIVFLLYLALDTNWKKNSVGLIGHFILHFLLLVYYVILAVEAANNQYGLEGVQDYRAVEGQLAMTMAQMGVVAVSQIFFGLAAWMSFTLTGWGWTVFTVIGESPMLRKAYAQYQVYLVLLKMCMFFVVFQLAITVANTANSLFGGLLVIVINVAACVILTLEWVALRWEKRWLLWTILLFNVLAMLWVTALVVVRDIVVGIALNRPRGVGASSRGRAALLWSFVYYLHWPMLVYIARFVLACICWHNIGKGVYKFQVVNGGKTPVVLQQPNQHHQYAAPPMGWHPQQQYAPGGHHSGQPVYPPMNQGPLGRPESRGQYTGLPLSSSDGGHFSTGMLPLPPSSPLGLPYDRVESPGNANVEPLGELSSQRSVSSRSDGGRRREEHAVV